MATKNRSDLKSYFVKNAIPTEGNFADLVDSQLNQAQDGVFKPDGDALSVVAAPGRQKRVLRLFANYPAANPDWMISLNPAQDPANAATTSKPGLGITDGTGKTRLFIDAATGQIGVGTNTPQVALDVAGTAQANGFRSRYDLVLNDYRTVNPASNVCLQSPANDRDAWIYRDPSDTANNWGIYHRQIDTAVGGLPGNSIGFVGGSGSTLQAYVNLADGSGFFAGGLSVQRSLDVTAKGSTSNYLLRLSNDAGSLFYISPAGIVSFGTNSGVVQSGYQFKVRAYNFLTDPAEKYNSHFPAPDNNAFVSGDNIYLRGGLPTGYNTILTATASNSSVTVAGNLSCRTLTQSSDERAKDHIEPIPGALEKVVRLHGVSFDWKADHQREGSPKHIGLIAQQVREVVPEAVMDEKGGLLSIAYNAITALLIEAIKEQQKQLDELRAALTPTPA